MASGAKPFKSDAQWNKGVPRKIDQAQLFEDTVAKQKAPLLLECWEAVLVERGLCLTGNAGYMVDGSKGGIFVYQTCFLAASFTP
jgi:hypothetical protein